VPRLRQNPTLSVVPSSSHGGGQRRTTGSRSGAGADDYQQAFRHARVVARVKAVLRRFERPTTPSILKFENVEIDASAMQLRVDGELVTTTATSSACWSYLARHPGRVFSRDHCSMLSGRRTLRHAALVRCVCRRFERRSKPMRRRPLPQTMRGAGYRFEIPKRRQPRRGGRF